MLKHIPANELSKFTIVESGKSSINLQNKIMKKNEVFSFREKGFMPIGKILKIMKVLTFIILVTVLHVSARSYSQNTKLSLNMQNASIKQVLAKIEDQSEFRFLYSDSKVNVENKVDVDFNNKSVEDVLQSIFQGSNIQFRVVGRQILLSTPTENINGIQQQKNVSGKVTDSSGGALPGASVVVKGTTVGAITDSDGSYSLSDIPTNATLQFTFIGMKMQEVAIENNSIINVKLLDDAIGIEEVVAIGYGVQQKKLITGATNQVDGTDIHKRNTPAVMDALKGQIPGVNITKISAQPGDGFKVNIRGLGTTGNSAPLYVLDGVTVPNINNLNPADIESLDVLKDAASAAIYGARASNGVILVTTKKGKVGKPTISYDSYYGVQNAARKLDFLGAKDYLMLDAEYYTNNNAAVPNYSAIIPGYQGIANGTWNGTNWIDEVTNKNAPTQNHSVSIAGGTEQAIYSMGLSLDSQEGIIGKPATPTYDRYTFRLNTEYTLIKAKNLDILKVGENFNYSNTTRHVTISEGASNWQSFAFIASGSPVIQAYNPDPTKQGPYTNIYPYDKYGSPTGVSTQAPNPLAWLDYAKSGTLRRNSDINGNIYLTFQPIKDLVFRSAFGINSATQSDRSYVPSYNLTIGSSYFTNATDITTQALESGLKWTFDNTLNYKFTLNGKNNFDILAGTSAEKTGIGESISGSNGNSLFNSFEYAYLINNKQISPAYTILSGQPLLFSRLLSFFGRASYDYKQTYMATAVFRADGSSNFAPGKRWGYFPSFSAGWAISNEPFMDQTKSWLDFLKFRASWGENGNQSIVPFQYLSTISFNGAPFFKYSDRNKFVNGGFPNIISNPDVSWEISAQTDIGFDARLFAGKLGVNFDWYDKLTKDWLIQAPILATDGTGAPYKNGGDVRNRGYEIAITWNDQIGEFNYGITANFSQLKNEVTRIDNPEGIIHGPNGVLQDDQKESYRAQVGYPIGYFWGLQSDGLFQNAQDVLDYKNTGGKVIQPGAQPGDMRFVDQNDDGAIDQNDNIMLGDPNPNIVFGLSFNCSYKGFDLNVMTNGVAGNQIMWNYFNNNNHGTNNWTTAALSRWHGEGTSNSFPRINTGSVQDIQLSDRFISDADYWRISNVTLGYDFKTLWKTSPLQQIRLFVSAQNLYTFTNYEGYNPEVGGGGRDIGNGSNAGNWAGGIDVAPYPLARTFMIGAAIKF